MERFLNDWHIHDNVNMISFSKSQQLCSFQQNLVLTLHQDCLNLPCLIFCQFETGVELVKQLGAKACTIPSLSYTVIVNKQALSNVFLDQHSAVKLLTLLAYYHFFWNLCTLVGYKYHSKLGSPTSTIGLEFSWNYN